MDPRGGNEARVVSPNVPNINLLNAQEVDAVARAIGDNYRPATTATSRRKMKIRVSKSIQRFKERGSVPIEKALKLCGLSSIKAALGLEDLLKTMLCPTYTSDVPGAATTSASSNARFAEDLIVVAQTHEDTHQGPGAADSCQSMSHGDCASGE